MENKTVLLIEDNPNDVALTLRAFKKNNFKNKIVVMNDGEKALKYLFRREEYADRDKTDMPELILLDLKMPKLTGLEVLKIIRETETTSIIPVIVLSTSQEEKDIISSYKLGANSFIHKPVDFNKFNEAIKQLGLYWLMLNEKPPLLLH